MNEENKVNLKDYKRTKKTKALTAMNLKRAKNPLKEIASQRREEMKSNGSLGKSELKNKKSDLKP